MNAAEYETERRHIYETRLAILEAPAFPTAEQHNMAQAEAAQHMADLSKEGRNEGLAALLALRDSLKENEESC